MNTPMDGMTLPVEELIGIHPFNLCSKPSLARLVPRLKLHNFNADEVLYRDGEAVDIAYVVLEGAVALERNGEKRVENVLVGEEAGLGLARRDGTARITDAARLLTIPADALAHLGAENPRFRSALLDLFCHRETTAKEKDTSQSDSLGEIIGWILTLCVPALVHYLLSSTLGQTNPNALRFLTIGSASVMMWAFQLLPEFVPALLALLWVILLGLAPPQVALSGFGSSGFVIALSIFGLSVVIRSSGLSYRVLLWLLRIGPPSKTWYRLALFITGVALTPIVPSANGRVSIVAPLLNDLLQALQQAGERERQRLQVVTLSGVSLFSAIFLSSKSINFIVFGFLPHQAQMRFQWLTWFYAASVVAAVMLALYVLIDTLLFRNNDRPTLPKPVIIKQLAVLGPLSRSEWAGIAGLLALIISFVTTSFHHIAVPWITLAILAWLLMFGFIDRDEFRQNINWNFLVFLGALIGLMAVMRHVGLDQWLADRLGILGQYMRHDFAAFIALLAVAIFVARLALPINATIVIFASILIPYASAVGINAWLVGFLILFLSESFILPYQSSYYLQFASIVGDLKTSDRRVLLYNLLLTLAKPLAIYASIPFWHQMGVL